MKKFCDFFTFRPYDLITTFTYVFMGNFCPCFRDVPYKIQLF